MSDVDVTSLRRSLFRHASDMNYDLTMCYVITLL
jgi:hypothetical protein